MHIYTFGGEDLKMMLTGSVNALGKSRAEIDALNVFPVPDGDTGTNMYLTLLEGVKEARQVEGDSIGQVAAAAARGCLYGARGNSGVILSQIVQGFGEALANLGTAAAGDLASAFNKGLEAAYQSVSEPVEGTILTVCRETAVAVDALSKQYSDLVRIMVYVYKRAQAALAKTPELLPVLKEAGVVDAGGQGFVTILYGIIQALKDAAAQRDIQLFDLAVSQQKDFVQSRTRDRGLQLEYTYCTEFIISGDYIPLDLLREELVPYGDCLLVVGDDSTAKVHIHSNHPGLVLECGLKYGALQKIHINNMEEQSQEAVATGPQAEKRTAVVAVGAGEGIATILESMGADAVVTGGQTMNPSADDLLQAINDLPAGQVIILPNNKNIVMAADQAAKMTGKLAAVVPTWSIPQGVAALLAYNPLEDLEENKTRMQEASGQVLTGEITRAVRETVLEGVKINKGQYIGLAEGKLKVSGDQLKEVTGKLVGELAGEEESLVTLYYGAELGSKEAGAILQPLQQQFPGLDFELYYGGQPLYQFLISVE